MNDTNKSSLRMTDADILLMYYTNNEEKTDGLSSYV